MNLDNLRGLSIQRPWANLVMRGYKPIENRGWNTKYRGTLAIQAGTKFDPFGAELATELIPASGQFQAAHTCEAGWLGTVDLIDVHPTNECDGCTPWGAPTKYHWQFDNPRRFETPMPGRGHLGLVIPPREVRDAVSELLADA